MCSLRAILLILAMAIVPAHADDDDDRKQADRARQGALTGQIMPLSRLADAVLARYPGRLIEVELDSDDGIQVYEIKILQPDGRVLEMEVDAHTAAILEVDVDD